MYLHAVSNRSRNQNLSYHIMFFSPIRLLYPPSKFVMQLCRLFGAVNQWSKTRANNTVAIIKSAAVSIVLYTLPARS